MKWFICNRKLFFREILITADHKQREQQLGIKHNTGVYIETYELKTRQPTLSGMFLNLMHALLASFRLSHKYILQFT